MSTDSREHVIADAHVDVLWRMEQNKVSFYGDSPLQAGFSRLSEGGVKAQVFALYVSPELPGSFQMETVLRSIDIFYRQVVQTGSLAPVRTQSEWRAAVSQGEIAGLLSLEGGGCLRGQVELLRILFDLGVRGVGLTWNDANELADGCRESRGAGLTEAGVRVVREMEHLGMWVDIAHLADAGVRDVFRTVDGPVMASHANSRAVLDHPRNLTDDVVRELVRRNGWIGLVFEGSFVSDPRQASVEGVFRHLDHFLDLGAEDCVGFGSDFDGTTNRIPRLSNASDYANFAELVADRYGAALAKKILFDNFQRFAASVLPFN